jgi:hypothetical protein
VIPGDREHRSAQRTQEMGGPLVLLAAPPVGQVARRDDQLGRHPFDEGGQGVLDRRILRCTRVQVGYMEEAPRHDRMRL